ncbi:unnamed protein product [Thlaspi arvense]|uniref:Uncharacterized protein n=1 Tax=Thlaspi arvense TaxID=13288 RepID=A0AAU9RUJ8_THLAR|nr:unnamed protein product [Thlaspi arvense]
MKMKDTVDVTVKLHSRQSITCEVKLSNGDQFYYTAIYASNLSEERTDLWIKLLDAFQFLKLGPRFTWTNCRPSSSIAENLDRILVNMSFVSNFAQSSATLLPPLIFDHCPCMLDIVVPLPTVGTVLSSPFNYLTKHPSFLQVVFDAWAQLEVDPCPRCGVHLDKEVSQQYDYKSVLV